MKKLLQRLLNKVPKYRNNVWYNSANYIKDRYPKIFDNEGNYIECKLGLIVYMGETKSGKGIYYKVSKVWYKSASDYLYQSDGVNCNLIFDHIK